MLTEVMRHYGLKRRPIDAGFFETEHHAQVSRDIRAAIMGGRLIALTPSSARARRSCRGSCAPSWSRRAA